MEIYTIPMVFILSLLMNAFIIKATTKYSFFMDPLANHKIQSFHKNLTPRAGGLSIYFLSLVISYFVSETMFFASLAFLPSFMYGIYEDIKGDTPQKVRLLLMSISCLITIMFTGLTVQTLGFFHIPIFLQIPFAIFAVIGLSSAINFIDGLHGLASGVTIITLTIFGLAAHQANNHELPVTLFFLACVMAGFFICNFPSGRIFLGDAGAYYLGYILAISSEALVFQSPDISPWFPAAILAYPIIETLFTIWRRFKRLKNKGIRFFTPERVHLHSLLYLRVFKSNPLTSVFILSGFLLNSIIIFPFRNSSTICAFICIGEVLIYLYIYNSLVNFKVGKFAINLMNFINAFVYPNKSRKTIFEFSKSNAKTEFLYKAEDKIT
jgi:UDP-GlcNAc:undecaprenyl-phosphate GlcNAc-1-phosphate transferase